jgi:hypothetical protein
LAQSRESVVGIGERLPVKQALREELGALAAYPPSEALADTRRRVGEDFAIAPILRCLSRGLVSNRA